MTPEEIRAAMQLNIVGIWAKGDADRLPELYAEDCVDHNPMPGQAPGLAGMRDVMDVFTAAFPDIEMTLHGALADGDHGVDFWTLRATHRGELAGIPATGRRVEFSGIDVARFDPDSRRVVEIWHVEDQARMLAQLGALTAVRQRTGVRRGYVDGRHGQLHYSCAGAGPAVLLLHQTPRSWDEYRDVLPLLADRGLRAVALDTPGYGGSDPPPEDSVEEWTAGAVDLLDGLGIGSATVVGHHTGGVIAVELAASAPDRVTGLVLSSTPYVDAGFRARPLSVDDVERCPDGSHLAGLWQGRQRLYPADRPDLLERFVRDALAAGPDRAPGGHAAVRRYRMEERLRLVGARTLLVGAARDPYGFPQLERMRAELPDAAMAVLDEGMVPLPDQLPVEFAALVADFVLSGSDGAR